MKKELYDEYKMTLGEKFKSDFLEVCVQTYGEKHRSQFEENMKRIVLHSKITVDQLKEIMKEKGLNEESSDSLLQEAISEHESGKKEIEQNAVKKKIGLQLGVLEEIKKELSPEDALELEKELQQIELDGSFDLLKMGFLQVFEDKKLDMLQNIVNKYKLDAMLCDKDKTGVPSYVDEYHERAKAVEKEKNADTSMLGSSYDNLLEELSDVDEKDLQDLDLPQEMGIKGSFVAVLKDKEDPTQGREHIFLETSNDKGKNLGKLAHEMLHAMERKTRYNNETGELETRTGFKDYNQEDRALTLESECIHSIILSSRIYPKLRELGYDIDDSNDYEMLSLGANVPFYNRYEQAILDARCDGMEGLYDIVGKENFANLVDIQDRRSPTSEQEANVVLANMQEHERENLGTRIGKFTLPMQENVLDKQQAQSELAGLQKEEMNVGVRE